MDPWALKTYDGFFPVFYLFIFISEHKQLIDESKSNQQIKW